VVLRSPYRRSPLLAGEIFPTEFAIPFGVDEARLTADLYRAVGRARGRKFDLAIAACAIVREAELWTLNLADFQDIPGLRLCTPESPQ
jgi:predicted nucleic acid-binding protein